MRRKLALEVEALAVDSFETTGEARAPRGTVEAREAPCTCWQSCACPSAPYWCADVPPTQISCDYTHNASCWYTQQTCTPA